MENANTEKAGNADTPPLVNTEKPISEKFTIKAWIKKHPVICIFLLSCLLLVVIPLCINWTFKCSWGISLLEAEWSASDALSFYGAVLAAGLGIIGVFFSIQYAQKNYREDLKNQSLPYFVVTRLSGKSSYPAFSFPPEKREENDEQNIVEILKEASQNAIYKEEELSQIRFTITGNDILPITELTEEQTIILRQKGRLWKEENGVNFERFVPYLSCPMYIENVGNGPALYSRIGFYKDGAEPTCITAVHIKKDKRFYIHIFSSANSPEELHRCDGKYILRIRYQDLYKNSYEQEFPFEIRKDGCEMTLGGSQKQISSLTAD